MPMSSGMVTGRSRLPGQLAVDVELRARRRALAVREVGLAGRLELEAQLVPPVGDRGVGGEVELLDAEEVVGVVELVVLDVERVAARRVRPAPPARPRRRSPVSTVAVMLCGRLRTRARDLVRDRRGARVVDVALAVDAPAAAARRRGARCRGCRSAARRTCPPRRTRSRSSRSSLSRCSAARFLRLREVLGDVVELPALARRARAASPR